MMPPDQIVGERYRIVRALGGGGMKRVYLARDQRLQRECALAEMIDSFDDAAQQAAAIAAFEREADLLARLESEHIPRIFDRFSEDNRHFLVMEYAGGETLEQKLMFGKLSEALVIQIVTQILDTLVYLHGLEPPIIYRDLKPSNLILRADGLVRLVDFGIARHFESSRGNTSFGTQGYSPPEQYFGRSEARSDLYALGALMHHLLTGRDPTQCPPFSFPSVCELRPDADPRLAELIDTALAYEIDQRMNTAQDFRHALEQIAIGGTSGGLRGGWNFPGAWVRKNRRSIRSATLVMVPLAGVIAAALLLQGQSSSNPVNSIGPNRNHRMSSPRSISTEDQLPRMEQLGAGSSAAADTKHDDQINPPSGQPDESVDFAAEPLPDARASLGLLADNSPAESSMRKAPPAEAKIPLVSPASDDASADEALARFRGCWSTPNVFQVVNSIAQSGMHAANGTIAPVALKFCWNRTADNKTKFEPPESSSSRNEYYRSEGNATLQWLDWLVPGKDRDALVVHVEELKVQTLANSEKQEETADYDCQRKGLSLECSRTYVKAVRSLPVSDIVSHFQMRRAGHLIVRRSTNSIAAVRHDPPRQHKFWPWLARLFRSP